MLVRPKDLLGWLKLYDPRAPVRTPWTPYAENVGLFRVGTLLPKTTLVSDKVDVVSFVSSLEFVTTVLVGAYDSLVALMVVVVDSSVTEVESVAVGLLFVAVGLLFGDSAEPDDTTSSWWCVSFGAESSAISTFMALVEVVIVTCADDALDDNADTGEVVDSGCWVSVFFRDSILDCSTVTVLFELEEAMGFDSVSVFIQYRSEAYSIPVVDFFDSSPWSVESADDCAA